MRALIEQVKIRAVDSFVAALGVGVVSVLAMIEKYLVDWLAPKTLAPMRNEARGWRC